MSFTIGSDFHLTRASMLSRGEIEEAVPGFVGRPGAKLYGRTAMPGDGRNAVKLCRIQGEVALGQHFGITLTYFPDHAAGRSGSAVFAS